ncbi:MAG: hypothetical protein JWP36_2067 [Paucimonas sp.]|nr:hypothetical protein [Paucimonas sp.]
MRFARYFLTVPTFLLATACSVLAPPSVTPGESEATVISRLGKPTGVYQDGSDRLLEYRTNPGGQNTWMVRVGPNGAKSIEQVLTVEKFATIRPGQDKKEDVLRKVGAPYETSYLRFPDLTVWTYMYLENGAWDSLMHVHFDNTGTVKMLMNAPDLWRRPVAGGHGN